MVVAVQGAGDFSAQAQVSAVDVLCKELAELLGTRLGSVPCPTGQ